MFRKIHSVFHPNSCSRDLTEGNASYNGTLSPVRLVRSTSMYVVGGGRQTFIESLKKYKSTTNIDSSGCHYKDEDTAWLFAKTQDFLQYLQDLLALRKKYLSSLHHLRSATDYSTISTKSSKGEKRTLPPPSGNCKVSKENTRQHLNCEILDAIAYFDAVIAELDSERRIRAPIPDFKNEDVDFDVATSSSEHSLHSNWILRAPRRSNEEICTAAVIQYHTWRTEKWTTSIKRIERHPVYLPKAVEGAFNTLNFKPNSKSK
ncbi:uncharacterized protein C13orf42-like [Xenopus laevis]|uniref:Uncharacterized protein n=2 Tax=Xenopus laevis TaxID=8355 RepID=A0A974DLS5_XENLA|nr:uncharacterized protein C13orf42-like [Xenopus laevis]OCT93057.1 hypothetical protein XELAEV_18016124mg [Xenopus laevis]